MWKSWVIGCISEFECYNKQCVSVMKVCDGVSDCSDDSDESNCGMKLICIFGNRLILEIQFKQTRCIQAIFIYFCWQILTWLMKDVALLHTKLQHQGLKFHQQTIPKVLAFVCTIIALKESLIVFVRTLLDFQKIRS